MAQAQKKEVIRRRKPAPTIVRGGGGGGTVVASQAVMLNERFQVGGSGLDFGALGDGYDKPTLEDIKRRQGQAESLLSSQKQKAREIAFYFLPRDSDWNITSDRSGRNRAEGLLDNTGVEAINHLVDNGMSRLMPLEADWFSLVMTPFLSEFLGETQRRLEIEGELKRYSGIVRKYLDGAEFRKAMRTAMANFLVFGYVAVLPRVGMDGEGVVFEVFANNTLALEYAPSITGGLFWRTKVSVRNWNRTHPYAEIQGNSDAEKEIIHACVPIGFQWVTAVYEDSGDRILYAEWHDKCPVVVGKMAAAAGDTYPQGLGGDNLTEVQLLNETRYRAMQLLVLKTTPMFIMNSALNLDNFQFRPGGAAVVDTDIGNNVENAIAPVPVGGDSNYSMAAQEEMRNNVRDAMAIMPKAPLDSKGFRTAFEWKLAQIKEQEGVGEKVDAFRTDVILPCIRQAVGIIHNLEDSPLPAGLVIDGENFDIKVEGTQERARKLGEVQDIMGFVELLGMLPPDVVGPKVDFDAALTAIMENLNMGDLALSEEAADQWRAEYAAAQEQMAAQQAQAQGAPAAG